MKTKHGARARTKARGGPLDKDEDESEGDLSQDEDKREGRARAGDDPGKFRVTRPLAKILSDLCFFRLSVFSGSRGPCFRYCRYLCLLS